MDWRRKIHAILLVGMLLSACSGTADVSVPNISDLQMEIDGQFEEEYWNRASIHDISQKNQLYLLQSETDLFIGIKNQEEVARYVDLYIAHESANTLNLHASMQLGERTLGNQWNDTIPAWNWGNNKDWQANTVRLVDKNKELPFHERLQAYQGFEFRINKDRIQGEKIRIRIEIKDFVGKAEEVVFPAKSARKDIGNWLELMF